MQKLANYITVDENVQFGKPVFKGTGWTNYNIQSV